MSTFLRSVVKLTLPSALVFLAACASTYSVPPGHEVAYLRVVDPWKKAFPPSTSTYTFSSASTCEGRLSLPERQNSAAEELPNGFLRIEAGKPFALLVLTTTEANRFCAPIVLFTPIAGRFYSAESSNLMTRCFLQLSSAKTSAMEDAKSERVQGRYFRRGFLEASSWCTQE